jgi:hypothetical protein
MRSQPRCVQSASVKISGRRGVAGQKYRTGNTQAPKVRASLGILEQYVIEAEPITLARNLT